jgi:hypothetical protein
MPIGKNSIKRVANNGYSKVSSSAPDMENSVIEETKAAPKTKKPTTKKTTAKKSQTGTVASKKSSPKTTQKTAKEAQKTAPVSTYESASESKQYVNIGDSLPVYLL